VFYCIQYIRSVLSAFYLYAFLQLSCWLTASILNKQINKIIIIIIIIIIPLSTNMLGRMFNILFQFYTDRARLTTSSQELFYRYCGLTQSIHLTSATEKT